MKINSHHRQRGEEFLIMKRAYIFANGRMDSPTLSIKEINPADLVIAADGGTHHCQSLGLTPNVIIGDLDSLSDDDVNRYERNEVKIIRYPAHKDETDLELALIFALEQAIEEVVIIGALGARWDMTFANMMLAAQDRFSGLSIRLVDRSQELNILKAREEIELRGKKGQMLSLIPIGGDVTGVTIRGLEYPLDDETLFLGSPRGVSNVINGDYARITVSSGILLVCLSTQVESQKMDD